MAAGMGSRYGSLKQIDPVGENGEVIIDYSVFDAKRAGFEKVIFVIKKEIEEQFHAVIGDRLSKFITVEYAFQDLNDLPQGFTVPEGRAKPWGTCHAVLSARNLTDSPFAVINADDYYGPHAFKLMYSFLSTHTAEGKYAMVGYNIENTLTENGTVSRGVCDVSKDGYLKKVTERKNIMPDGKDAKYTEDGGVTWQKINAGTQVSMNLWGFSQSFFDYAEARFKTFLSNEMPKNPLAAEYYLPSLVSALIDEGKASVKVLNSPDKWFGVTYRPDKAAVQAALKEKHANGEYPTPLWK